MTLKKRKVSVEETRFIDSRNLTDDQLNQKIAAFESDGFTVTEFIYMPEVPPSALNNPVIRAVELTRYPKPRGA